MATAAARGGGDTVPVGLGGVSERAGGGNARQTAPTGAVSELTDPRPKMKWKNADVSMAPLRHLA